MLAEKTKQRPQGLSSADAARRLADGQGNVCRQKSEQTVGRILRRNLLTLFNGINLLLALALIAVGSYRNLLFMGIIVSNTLIGTFQELRAKRTVDKLTLLSQSPVTVLRDGSPCSLPPNQLVLGDVIILRTGEQLPADARVLDGQGEANESLLTGESEPVAKAVGDELLSGSFLTEGVLTAELIRVGDDSYAAQMTATAKVVKRAKSELMSAQQKIIRTVSFALVPLGALMFVREYFFQQMALSTVVPSVVAAMIGMIPEGLILLTSVALAVGVVRLGQRHTLVNELYGIESLARVDTLCIDKTGTITEGRMKLAKSLPYDHSPERLTAAVARLLQVSEEDNATFTAVREAYAADQSARAATLVPFSSARKWSGASFEDGGTVIMGAPEFVLDAAQHAALLKDVAGYAAEGYRVLAVVVSEQAFAAHELPAEREPIGLLLLTDVLRPDAAETLAYFRKQQVTVKVISGDNPLTVAKVAAEAGLENADRCIDAATLTTPELLNDAAGNYTVFGRVKPEQKRALVEALRASGHTVAMMGDGVNDIPALKAADCSVVMAGGSDAAKRVAQMTLLDKQFSTMPYIVAEGRRVINNITRSASLFLVKTCFSFLLSIAVLLLGASYPFQPIQLTLISTMAIGIPSFFLALQPNTAPVKGRFLRNVLRNALPGALTIVAEFLLINAFSGSLSMDTAERSTLMTIVTGATALMVLYVTCFPFDRLRAVLCAAVTAGFCIGCLFFRDIFFLVPLPPSSLPLLIGLIVGALPCLLLLRWLLKLLWRA